MEWNDTLEQNLNNNWYTTKHVLQAHYMDMIENMVILILWVF